MKRIKILYWIFTVLLIALMLMSAITSLMNSPDGKALMEHLGYPAHLLTFLSVAKILGIVAILVPGYPRLKEWAYAGFTFDLIGAVYSGLAAGDPLGQWAFVFIGLVFVFGSYIFYHKRIDYFKEHQTLSKN